MVITLALTWGLVFGLVVWIVRRRRGALKAVGIGALVFLVFQLLTRIPMLQVLSGTEWYRALAGRLFWLALFLSVTAGLFEEVGRYLGFRFLLKNQLDVRTGVAYGIGHGGFEALALVGMTYINNLVLSLAINSGKYDAMTAALGPSAALIREQFVNLPPTTFLAAGIERAMTIIIHIALSLVVLHSVRAKKPLYLLLAIGLHTLVNLPAVILAGSGVNTWVIELLVVAMAAAGLVYILRSWRAEVPVPAGLPASDSPGENNLVGK